MSEKWDDAELLGELDDEDDEDGPELEDDDWGNLDDEPAT